MARAYQQEVRISYRYYNVVLLPTQQLIRWVCSIVHRYQTHRERDTHTLICASVKHVVCVRSLFFFCSNEIHAFERILSATGQMLSIIHLYIYVVYTLIKNNSMSYVRLVDHLHSFYEFSCHKQFALAAKKNLILVQIMRNKLMPSEKKMLAHLFCLNCDDLTHFVYTFIFFSFFLQKKACQFYSR